MEKDQVDAHPLDQFHAPVNVQRQAEVQVDVQDQVEVQHQLRDLDDLVDILNRTN